MLPNNENTFPLYDHFYLALVLSRAGPSIDKIGKLGQETILQPS